MKKLYFPVLVFFVTQFLSCGNDKEDFSGITGVEVIKQEALKGVWVNENPIEGYRVFVIDGRQLEAFYIPSDKSGYYLMYADIDEKTMKYEVTVTDQCFFSGYIDDTIDFFGDKSFFSVEDKDQLKIGNRVYQRALVVNPNSTIGSWKKGFVMKSGDSKITRVMDEFVINDDYSCTEYSTYYGDENDDYAGGSTNHIAGNWPLYESTVYNSQSSWWPQSILVFDYGSHASKRYFYTSYLCYTGSHGYYFIK